MTTYRVDLIDLRNGVMVLQTPGYSHMYDTDALHLAAALRALRTSDPACDWDGNEADDEDYEPMDYDPNDERNGAYRWYQGTNHNIADVVKAQGGDGQAYDELIAALALEVS